MDPIAHTMFGATLAETGLKKLSRHATATLIIGANLPDIDAVMTVFGRDLSLLHRRGITHGVIAMVVLPLMLAAGMALWSRRRPAAEGDPPFRLGAIIGLSYLSVWSHPALDWMNTYGVRLLMPFDGTWFYGSTLFIVDPWFWLTTAAGVVLARSSSKRSIAGWVVLAALASLLVVGFPAVPIAAKILWVAGVATIVGLRRFKPVPSQHVARAGLSALLVYLGVAFGLARTAEQAAAGESAPEVAQANPVPANPFEHRVVLVYPDHYRIVQPSGETVDVPREEPDEVVKAALAAPEVAGFANWMRFPIWEKEQLDDGWRVTFRDLRYVEPGGESRGIGLATVELDANLLPR